MTCHEVITQNIYPELYMTFLFIILKKQNIIQLSIKYECLWFKDKKKCTCKTKRLV